METKVLPTRISRVDSRYRHWAQDVSLSGEAARGKEEKEEEELPPNEVGEPLLIREQKGRAVMGKAHRLFHRRAAQEASRILTVNVAVLATLDASGNVLGRETVTASIPGVPAMPTVPLPSVPSVPAFPSDLTVPAYPWPLGVATVPTGPTSSQVVISSLPSTSVVGSSSLSPTPFPSASVFNSTISSTISSTAFSSSFNSSTTSSSQSSTRSSTSSARTSTSSTSLTTPASSSATVSSSAIGGGGGGNPANTAPPPAATAASSADPDDGSALDTPQVVGTVFGSLAGAALILALILFLIKRHKRTQQNRNGLQLTGDDNTDNQPMTQTAARSSFVPPSFLNRFSGASRSTAGSSGTGERGFQRISGRKLPSAFSEGMTSEQFARGEGTLSGSSFYRDEKGFYGGPGVASKDFGKETEEPSNSGVVGVKERVMPSPARTPVIHHPDDAPPFGTSRNGGGSTLSPPHTPHNPDFPPRGTLGRSHPSHDGSRSSRFTENV